MMKQELKIEFVNPNTDEQTIDMLAKVIAAHLVEEYEQKSIDGTEKCDVCIN